MLELYGYLIALVDVLTTAYLIPAKLFIPWLEDNPVSASTLLISILPDTTSFVNALVNVCLAIHASGVVGWLLDPLLSVKLIESDWPSYKYESFASLDSDVALNLSFIANLESLLISYNSYLPYGKP